MNNNQSLRYPLISGWDRAGSMVMMQLTQYGVGVEEEPTFPVAINDGLLYATSLLVYFATLHQSDKIFYYFEFGSMRLSMRLKWAKFWIIDF